MTFKRFPCNFRPAVECAPVVSEDVVEISAVLAV